MKSVQLLMRHSISQRFSGGYWQAFSAARCYASSGTWHAVIHAMVYALLRHSSMLIQFACATMRNACDVFSHVFSACFAQAMESDNLVWLLLGMLLAIGGALFMGCAAFISEQHAMISHVIVLEDPLHPPVALGTGGMFPLHNGGSSAPAPTSQSDWQHNMAALEERMRVGDSGRYSCHVRSVVHSCRQSVVHSCRQSRPAAAVRAARHDAYHF